MISLIGKISPNRNKAANGLPKIIVFCGPTGVGKTAMSLEAARKFDGEIVNADSMQVYRELDVGTAKPTAEEQSVTRHHLIDILEPTEEFDAARFVILAKKVITEIGAQGKIPLVVGGTGFYIKALIYGLPETALTDPAIRQHLKNEQEQFGSQALYDRLKKVDAVTAKRLHPNDTFRVIRALEVYAATGKPLSEIHAKHRFQTKRYEALKIGLNLPRQELYDRIDHRVLAMMDAGFLQEVEALMQKGYSADLKSMQALGYRHMTACLRGKLSFEEAVTTMQRDTRHYAKRQLTWFKKDPEIHWLHPDDWSATKSLIEGHLKPS